MTAEKARAKEAQFFEGLQVPVNPNYDFEKDPSLQTDYANPVMLSNKLVLYANALLQITKGVMGLARRREGLRLERRTSELKLNAMRREVLAQNPAPPAASKNLALTEAYVFRCLESNGVIDLWKALEATVNRLEDEIEGLKQEEDNLKYSVHTIKLASENITNKLSYVKAEAKMGFGG